MPYFKAYSAQAAGLIINTGSLIWVEPGKEPTATPRNGAKTYRDENHRQVQYQVKRLLGGGFRCVPLTRIFCETAKMFCGLSRSHVIVDFAVKQ